jgi:hypothetical protein
MKNLIKKILKENDFDWTSDVNPMSKSEISQELSGLVDFGYHSLGNKSYLINSIYNLGLTKDKLKDLLSSLYGLSEISFDAGHQKGLNAGYEEGYNEGASSGESREDLEYEFREREREIMDNSYEEGYSDGLEKGYQEGYSEGSEETYHKAFEEGRAYELGIDTEDFERRQSGFNPDEYDEEYDENY